MGKPGGRMASMNKYLLDRMQPANTHCAPHLVTASPIYDVLKRLFAESGLTVKELARTAKVEPQALNRFLNRGGKHYNAVSAELVHFALTGKPFTRHDVPLKRTLLKKGGKAA